MALFASVRDLTQAYKQNVLLETAVTAFGLGAVAMLAVVLMAHALFITSGATQSNKVDPNFNDTAAVEYACGLCLLVVHAAFHFIEFAVAAAQRPRETHPEAFMIFHSPAYLAANALSILEFCVEVFLVPESWKLFSVRGSLGHRLFRLNIAATTVYGVLVAVCYAIRVVAMIQCGPNFSLMIESEKRADHKLIQTGLYSVLRHPSYFGWFWRTPFSQLMLANPVCAVLHTAVTWKFFRDRIPYEESLLEAEDFFGEAYRQHRGNTIVGIPFIHTNQAVMSESYFHSFARTVLSVRRANLRELATSLHFFPVVMTASVAPAMYLAGHEQSAFITLYAGLAVLAVVLWLLPILTLTPLTGPYQASLREITSTKGKEPQGHPPVTAFYPTTDELKGVIRWLPFMDDAYLDGIAAYVGVPACLLHDMRMTQLEAHMDATPLSLYRKDGSQRPIFLYSHGLVGYPRLYSVFLSTVVAQGAIVIAVTHTDRSAAFCRDALNDFRLPLRTDLQLVYRDREPQLCTRIAEMQDTLAQVLNGNLLRRMGLPESEVAAYVADRPRVMLMGHSFGGATALATAHAEEQKLRRGEPNFASAIVGVVVQDPWAVPLWGRFSLAVPSDDGVEPTEKQKAFQEVDGTYSTPTLLHYSQTWKEDPAMFDFFEKLDAQMHAQLEKKDLLLPEQRRRIEAATARMAQAMAANEETSEGKKEKEDWYVTHVLMKTAHLSVTDISFLSPVVSKESYQTNRPEAPIFQWASEAMRFAEIHFVS